MSRLFEFPVEIDTDNIRATLARGLLKIRVPKAALGRRRSSASHQRRDAGDCFLTVWAHRGSSLTVRE
jgi:hypothetical protein